MDQQPSLPFKALVIIYLGAFATFLGIDFAWLSYANAAVYSPAIGHLMADQANLGAAFLFYLIYVGGVLYLAALPAKTLKEAMSRGAVLGLVAYGTYDMTSLAVFKDWPLWLTVLDMIWGSFLTTVVAFSGFIIKRSQLSKMPIS